MFSEFNSTSYFINLLALSVLLAPLIFFTPWASAKRILFILSGAYLIYFIAPRLLLFYAVFWSFVFLLQRVVAATTESKGGDFIFWVCLGLTLAPMIVWKLWFNEFTIAFNLWGNYAVSMLPSRLGDIDSARDIIIPIGLSFATFRAVDLLVKSYIGRFQSLSFDRVLFYGFFPPVQVVGPIIEYNEIEQQGERFRKSTADDLYQGLLRISFGLIKVLVFASTLQGSVVVFQNYSYMPLHLIWGHLFLYMWFFYLNFAGYSDLAIGTSRLFGFTLKENFNYPYFRTNIADFWNNWHMSLSHFAQRNAFVPLGGYRKKTRYVAIFATIMVIALWHDLSLGMLVFGVYHGIGLIVYRVMLDRKSARKEAARTTESILGNWVRIAVTYLFVALSFPLLVMPLASASSFYLALIGL